MNETHEQSGFIKQLKQRFDGSVGDLDTGTVSRITRCREEALAGGSRTLSSPLWLPAGAVATVCLALIVYILVPDTSSPDPAAETDPVIEQMDVISNLELYEDLEFYQWLAQDELPS